jgi:hypothetical protein
MARIFPVLPDTLGFDPAVPILETLGVKDPAAATAPADGQGLAEAIVVVSAANVQPGFDAEDSATATAPVFGTDVDEEGVSAHDPMAGLVTFDFNSIVEAGSSSSAIQSAADLQSFATHATVDFGNAAPGASPTDSGESAPVEAASAAKGGTPGPGGGSGGDTGVPTEYRSGSLNGDAGYDIWIQFKGSGWTETLQEAFQNAADYYTTVITEDIGGDGTIRNKAIDDLYVTAELRAIDGEGGILGQAGPSYVWTENDLTAWGKMQFDVADAQAFFEQGLWGDIVTHEMTHVLGFGSLWNYGDHVGLVVGDEYRGANGVAAYQATDPDATFIPVEDNGVSGTTGAHWDEDLLTNELMTGYIDNSNYLSEFSVMSLADLGYQVNNYQDYGVFIG